MEFKQERSNCKQFISTHKLRCQTDTNKTLRNNSPYKRRQHNIKSKVADGHKCKKCQEKTKNKQNHEDLFIDNETTTHNKKEINIWNTIQPTEGTKFKEKINNGGFRMERGKKKEGNMTVYGETIYLNRNKHISTNNTNKIQKYLEVTFSDQSHSSTTKHNKESGMEKPHTRQKKIMHTVSNNFNRMNLDSKIFIKECEIQKQKNVKQDGPIAVQVQPESSNFLTLTKDSIKSIHSYREEMNRIKHNNQKTYPSINVTSVEKNINNIIDIYESRSKIKTEKPGGPVGDTENLKYKRERENIKKEYLMAEKGRQTENLISNVMIQNSIQGTNLYNKEKKKSRFSNTFKDGRREETEKKSLENSGIKPPDNATLSCDIYENSIGEKTPLSQRSLSASCLRFKTKMYKYKSRKNKILSTKRSTKNLSNKTQSKSLQNIKQNNLSNRSPKLHQGNDSKSRELTNFSASNKALIEPQKWRNDCELQKLNINNTCPKYDSGNFLICPSLSKINLEERVFNEDQWCFADPRLYSCDSELILNDGQRTINSSNLMQKVISPENSNESWSNGKISKSSTSLFEISSVASLEDFNKKFSETNNTLECSNCKDIEPVIHINTIQNEYNIIKSKLNENCYYKNEVFDNDGIIHSNNENVENNTNKLLKQTFPYQSAVTLISGFGSKSSLSNRKKSEGDLNQLNSSLQNIDFSLIKKDAAVSASVSYEILRKTKFLRDKAIMCKEEVPSKVKKQRREKLKKIRHNNRRETRHICDTLLGKKDEIHHSGCIVVPDILNQGDNETIEKDIFQHRKYKGIHSEKRQPQRNTKHHNSSSNDFLHNKEENKTDTYITEEELEDVKMKFKDNFKHPFNKENVKRRHSKSFWSTLRTGSRRLIRFLQDSASFKYCFKKNMFK